MGKGGKERAYPQIKVDPTTHSAGHYELYVHSGVTCLYITVAERLSPGLIVMRTIDLILHDSVPHVSAAKLSGILMFAMIRTN